MRHAQKTLRKVFFSLAFAEPPIATSAIGSSHKAQTKRRTAGCGCSAAAAPTVATVNVEVTAEPEALTDAGLREQLGAFADAGDTAQVNVTCL
jgi:hypothetical protein